MRFSLLVSSFFLFTMNAVFSQSESGNDVVMLQKNVNHKEGSFQLKFENKKNIESSKMSLFTQRLENYYQEIDNIEFLSSENQFVLFFNTTEVNQEKIKDILSHFDVYNYEYK